MKNQEDHLRGALNESVPGSSRETPPHGACTVLIVPNQDPSTTSNTKEGEPSEGTMLVVSEDGWIKGEPDSPEGHEQSIDGGNSRRRDGQQLSDDMSGMESDFDIDENDADDDDWVPDPDSDSDYQEEGECEDNGSETKEARNKETIEINPDEPLTNEILKKIMEVVYGVPKPNNDTLVLLKEQMDDRPKLKVKLLKDLERGHSIFKRRHRYHERRNRHGKKQYVETPNQVSVENSVPEWTPHQPLTLARATAHLAAQQRKGENLSILPNPASASSLVSVPAPVHLPAPIHVSAPAHVPPFPHVQPRLPQMPQMSQNLYRPIAPKPPLLGPHFHLQNRIFNTIPLIPTRPPVTSPPRSFPPGLPSVPVLHTILSKTVTSTSSNPETNAAQTTEKTKGNIHFKDESSPQTRAVFMPEKRTVNIPELHPSPAGSLDVLVPVDATGQMKEPFMGIPLDSCNIIFNSDSEEEKPETNELTTKDTPGRSSNDCSQPGQSSSQSSPLLQPQTLSNTSLPSAGVFQNAKSKTSASSGIQPTKEAVPPKLIPPGMVPVGLAPASAKPTRVFPSHMFPPGSIPPGMVPVALPPDSLHYPIPGPHVRCTCPPGSRPPGPPVHSLLHLKQEDLKRLNIAGIRSPAINHQSGTPDMKNESASTSSVIDNKVESTGIKIASVRSCKSEEDLTNGPSSSLKESAQPGTSPSKAATEGMGNHPGSLLTVILPSSAKDHYKNKVYPKALLQPSSADLKEIHSSATKVDLGLVWNEISLLRSEIHLMKTKVASDIHNIRTDMEDFVKIVGEKLGITPVPQQNKSVQGSETENNGKRKREEGNNQIYNKQPKISSENL